MIYGLNKESTQILENYHNQQESSNYINDQHNQFDSYIDHYDRSDEKEKRSFLLSL